MLAQFTAWLLSLIGQLFTDVWNFLGDLLLYVLEGFLSAVAALFGAIAIPDWMSGGMQSLFSALDSGPMWFLSAMGLPQGMAFLGTAVLVRLIRKVITLFQW